ncbi:MAG: sugar ABC transporter permease [bacterium]|nr:sugar ABC transporter permease [bacterium]
MNKKKRKGIGTHYAKWGYICILPFIIGYLLFSLGPLIMTIGNSFFINYRDGLTQIGPIFNGLGNYVKLLKNADIWKYLLNTIILWLMGFVPQITLSLLLANWFADPQMRLKGSGFFKTVIYMPNLIMASAFAALFFGLFAAWGPINGLLMQLHLTQEPFLFFSHIWSTRGLIAFLSFLMWFGNTTLLLLAGIMNIDVSLYEAAQVDGASSVNIFWKITLPILRPILIYVAITSLIGGLQLFDVPQIMTSGTGNPSRSCTTMVMFLNNHLFSKNYGVAGAVSVLMFLVTGAFSLIVYFTTRKAKE